MKERRSIYKRLLAPNRLRQSSVRRESSGLEALSDKSRIISSAPFRRLQSKAQVFSLARSGAVRTRLTHSIEASNYGELIAESLAQTLVKSKSLSEELRLPFVQTVENACLLHDLGNPPFGHMGEYAIGRWFRNNREDLLSQWKQAHITPAEAKRFLDALERFDGNPQGLRIITRLQWLSDEYGMNLTCPLIAAYSKYLGGGVNKKLPFCKKIGYFPSEENTIKKTWEILELKTTSRGLPAQRHPLAFIMEAADDIAFCLSDIEDALEKSVISEREFLEYIRPKLPKKVESALRSANQVRDVITSNGTFHFFRLELSSELVDTAVRIYKDNEEAILQGTLVTSLLGTDHTASQALETLRDFAAERIYTTREAVEIELGGLKAIEGLLDAYRSMLLMRTDEFTGLENQRESKRSRPMEVLLRSLLPAKQMRAYEWQTRNDPKLEPIHRAQLIVDYLSGMTDTHTLKIYNIINGTGPVEIE
jgi:dGTPase